MDAAIMFSYHDKSKTASGTTTSNRPKSTDGENKDADDADTNKTSPGSTSPQTKEDNSKPKKGKTSDKTNKTDDSNTKTSPQQKKEKQSNTPFGEGRDTDDTLNQLVEQLGGGDDGKNKKSNGKKEDLNFLKEIDDDSD